MSEVAIEGYRLSPQQRRLWGALGGERAERESAQVALQVAGADAGRLRRALEEVCGRHEALRTGFGRLAGMRHPLQVITDECAVRWRDAGRVEDLRELLREERERASVGEGAGFGGCVAEVGGAGAVLALTAPALCCDLRSLVNVAREVAAGLSGVGAGGDKDEAEVVQYVQFSEWQNELAEGEGGEAGRAFWREALAAHGDGGEVRLGLEAAGGVDEEFEWGEVGATWEGASAELGQETLLSCWVALLGRLSGRSSVPVDVLFDGRKFPDLNESVGLFQTYLPININIGESHRFQEVVEKTARELKAAYPWQEYFPEVDDEAAGAEAARAPRHRFGYEYVEWPELGGADGPVAHPLLLSPPAEPFKLCLRVLRTGASLRLTLYHDSSRVSAGWARLLLGQYETLLRSCLADPSAPLSRHDALSQAEREDILSQSARNSRPYPTSPLLPELIAGAAQDEPEAEAVLDSTRSVTRRRLWRAGGRVASMLRASGVRRGDRVGLLAGRSAEAIAGLLGCWRLGAAYVPLDGSQPGSRLESMLDDCGARAVLTAGESPSVRGGDRVVLDLGAAGLFSDAGELDDEAGEVGCEAGDIAYLIYTSGTTGRPKGVAVTHSSLLNLLHALDESVYSQSSVRRVSVNAPLWFDASVKQLVQLGLGRALVVVPEGVRADAEALTEWVVTSGVEAFDCTPSHLRALLGAGLRRRCEESGAGLRHLLIGGEAVDPALWAELGGWRGVTSHNLYGPTECTVDVTHRAIGHEGAPTLGLPLGNVEAYVLDGRGRLCPSGVAGELCAGGAGIAVGYWGDARRTAEKFIPDSYSGRPGARLYRTGDVARRGADGLISYEGRADGQVKVRGFRIELGEVEAGLRQVDWVSEAAATVVGEGDSARLVGYVVAHLMCEGADCGHEAAGVREYVKELLPDYMVPAQVVALDSLPLTTNGKLDRRALPAPDELTTSERGEGSAPRTPHEEMLCGLFAGVLSVSAVGAEDNFFSLGGHSLLATQLVSRVREGFGVSLPLRSLFERPTPRALASEVEALTRAESAGGPPPLTRAERGEGGELPLSFAQQRLWFLDQLEPGSANYNCPAAVRLSGRLDVGALRRTLREVMRRHEALRARFVERDGNPVQVIGKAAGVKMPVIDLSGLGEKQREAEAMRLAAEQARESFDLRRGPLLRAAVVRLGAEEHVGLLMTHHIASDAWSKSILVRELSAIYDAYARGERSPLPEPEVQYGDYAAWQRGWLQGEALEEQLKYWRAKLAGAPASLELPTDRPRPEVLSYRGAHHTFTLPPELSARLVALSRERGVTLYMTLLAVFNILLHRYTGQEDIVVGTAIAGRNQPGVENLIGFFINTLALRTDLSGAPKFTDLLGQLKETALGAYAHQDVPFDKLVEELQPQRSLNRASLVEVTFGLQNVPKNILELPGLTISAQEFERESGRYDLTLWMSESEGQLRGVWTYLTELFDRETIERMTAHYETLLASAAEQPEARVNALEMHTAAEKEKLAREKKQQKSSNFQKFKSFIRKTPGAAAEESADLR